MRGTLTKMMSHAKALRIGTEVVLVVGVLRSLT
jgi:hypothetical protein